MFGEIGGSERGAAGRPEEMRPPAAILCLPHSRRLERTEGSIVEISAETLSAHCARILATRRGGIGELGELAVLCSTNNGALRNETAASSTESTVVFNYRVTDRRKWLEDLRLTDALHTLD
ncbi:hypothetical protein K0M31_019809 [Melipona bicolor]|uniref:Uncharacterized protein n=1 Tax=Melipona bicolor TaxID=60889 RepID=A0AA40KRK1_9HYME|nr:hypothetical protein K0M31_019809 [Melipona bicolor]